MALLLPILTFILTFLLIGNLEPNWSWRRSFLRSSLLWYLYLIIITELLSLFFVLRQNTLFISWCVPLIAILISLLILYKRKGRIILPKLRLPENWFEWVLLIGGGSILIITAVIAWFSPPHFWESLRYHMSRVAHWTQNQSVLPFATGIELQNSMPPGAEYTLLNFYILSWSDRLVNFVSWFAMLGSVIGVSLIAKQLGASPIGQWLSSIFSLTIPMGIIQSSSTQNDYVLAFWIVCLASEVLTMYQHENWKQTSVFLGLSGGFAVLTKGTAISYLVPFGALAILILIFSRRYLEILKVGITVLGIALLVNIGHITRSYLIYGNPISSEQISKHSNETHSVQMLISNFTRNASLHFGTPSPYVNKAFALSLYKLHDLIGIDYNDPRTTVHTDFRVKATSLSEVNAGNPIHFLLIFITSILLIARRKFFSRLVWWYWLAVFGTFVVFSFLFKWQLFGSRLHLPFFVLYAPLFGYAISTIISRWVMWGISILLLIAALFPLLMVEEKSVIHLPRQENGETIFTQTRDELYFGAEPGLASPMIDITQQINQADCKVIGLSISGAAAEYPWWVLLGAPDDDLLIEWLVAGAPSSKYALDGFSPCAVICDRSCPSGWTSVHGLPLAYKRAGFRLYMQP